MKTKLLSGFLSLTLICHAVHAKAQAGVTKYGTNALANNTIDGIYNSAFGYSTMFTNTTGARNTANGYKALYLNSTGSYNTAIGTFSLYHNTTSKYNTAIGYSALEQNTTGEYNTAIGYYSLSSNTDGFANTAIGPYSLSSNTSGVYNTANGYRSLSSNTTGIQNTASGHYSLASNTTGDNNTAIGHFALEENTTGNYNTATGQFCLSINTTGFANTASGCGAMFYNTTGFYNTAVGFQSLHGNMEGYLNTAIGNSSLYKNQTGNQNTATGDSSLFSNTTGNQNAAMGKFALSSNTTGSDNTALGAYADVSKKDLTNATAIGYKAKVNASNKVRVGNNAVISIGGQVNWTTFSDGRYKENIKENVLGLAFINSLRPVTYTVNIQGLNNYFDKRNNQDVNENKSGNELNEADNAAAKIVYNGFIAQEVEGAAKKLNYQFSGVDVPKNNNDLYGLRYAEFVVPLVKAVQELDKKQKNDIELLQKENDDLKERLGKLEAKMNMQQSTANDRSQTANLSSASLEQNIPNPFNHTTTINYTLPQTYSSVKIIITDKAGKVLKEINLPAARQGITGNGKGSLKVDASTLSSGAYQYSLYVDGKMINTKQMILAK